MKVPKLRFPEFKNNWEIIRLSDEGHFKTSNIDKLKYENQKEVKMVNYLDVYNDKNINKKHYNEFQTVTVDENQFQQYTLKNNDLLITPSSETPEDIGWSTAVREEIENLVYSYHLIRYRPSGDIDSYFLSRQLRHPKYRKKLIKSSQGATRFTLSLKNLNEIEVTIPKIDEQRKIGEFFASLDREIELYKIMLNKVQLLRQNYMITKLNSISKKDLEKIKLKKILKPYTKKNKEKELFEIVAVGKYGIRSRDEIYKNELSGNIQNMKIIYKNTMVFGMGTKQIDFGVVYDDDIFLVSSAYKTFEINHVDAFIFYEIFKVYNDYFSKKHMIIGARQGKSIDFSGLMNETIKYPKNTKIINEMKNNILQIDEYLSVLNKKISLLEKRKKAFLQQMFV